MHVFCCILHYVLLEKNVRTACMFAGVLRSSQKIYADAQLRFFVAAVLLLVHAAVLLKKRE
jgi:hypothetical protein